MLQWLLKHWCREILSPQFTVCITPNCLWITSLWTGIIHSYMHLLQAIQYSRKNVYSQDAYLNNTINFLIDSREVSIPTRIANESHSMISICLVHCTWTMLSTFSNNTYLMQTCLWHKSQQPHKICILLRKDCIDFVCKNSK